MEKTPTAVPAGSLRQRKNNLRSASQSKDLAAVIKILLYEGSLGAAGCSALRLCALLCALRLASETKKLKAATVRTISQEYRSFMNGKSFAEEFQCPVMRQLLFSIDPLLNPFNARMAFFEKTCGGLIKFWLSQFCTVLTAFIRLNCRSTSQPGTFHSAGLRQAQSENLVRRCFAVMDKISGIACPENPQTLAEEYREYVKEQVASAFLSFAYRQSVNPRQARGFSSPQGQLQIFSFALLATLADSGCRNELISFLPGVIVAWFYTDDHLKAHIASHRPPLGTRWTPKRVKAVFPPPRLTGIAENIMRHLHETGQQNEDYLAFDRFIRKEFKESLQAASRQQRKKIRRAA